MVLGFRVYGFRVLTSNHTLHKAPYAVRVAHGTEDLLQSSQVNVSVSVQLPKEAQLIRKPRRTSEYLSASRLWSKEKESELLFMLLSLKYALH